MTDDDGDENPPDVPWFAPGHRKSQLPPKGQPGELLFEFHVPATHWFWQVELRHHGDYGVEVQFFDPTELWTSRMFKRDLDPTRTPRELAIAWAGELRKELEQGLLRYTSLW